MDVSRAYYKEAVPSTRPSPWDGLSCRSHGLFEGQNPGGGLVIDVVGDADWHLLVVAAFVVITQYHSIRDTVHFSKSGTMKGEESPRYKLHLFHDSQRKRP